MAGIGVAPARVAGPGEATKVAVPRRTWTSSARMDSDLFGRLPTEVETGRCTQGGEPLLGDPRLIAEPGPNDGGSGRRGDQTDVGRVSSERGGQRLLVPDALRGDHDGR
jgi:hypothetical protein